MSTYKYLDNDGLLYVKGKLDTKFATKVDKETGKGLSTNDYTTTEKNKLSGISSGAQVNVIETVKVNGTALTPSSKAVDVTVPTALSDLTNDGNFVTDANYVHTDNNFTTTLKNKLDGIEASADVNKIETVKVNGTALTITSKAVDVTVPTNTNQLTNGAGFITKAVNDLTNYYTKTNTYTKTETDTAIANAISGITGISFEIVTTLPTTGNAGTIYLISNSGSGQNIYDEYIYVSNKWEKIGTTDVDLSGYVQATELVAITNSEIDTIFA